MEENQNESLKQSEEVGTQAEKPPTLTESQSEIVESENVNSDHQGGKKLRKPFVFTEARKAAFERCRVRRAEKLKEIREGVVSKPLTVREIKKELTRARLEYKSKIEHFKQSISRNKTAEQDQVTQSKDLTISVLQPNVSEALSVPAPVALSMEVNEVPITQAMMLAQQPQAQTQNSTSLSSAIAPSTEMTMDAEETSLSNPTPTPALLPSEERKRKHGVHFQDEVQTYEHAIDDEEDDDIHMGVGAGNHPPYQQVIDPSQLDDETLFQLLQEARQRQERSSMFESRRVEVKAPRPNNASMFLDTIQPMYNHPSQLFNVNSQFVKREPRPQASSSFVWL